MAIRFFLGINICEKKAVTKSTSEQCGQGPGTEFKTLQRPHEITVQWVETSNTETTQEGGIQTLGGNPPVTSSHLHPENTSGSKTKRGYTFASNVHSQPKRNNGGHQ